MRQYLPLVVWLTGILFPMALFTRYSATYNRWFQIAFTPEWTHIVMHGLLDGVLAVLLVTTLPPAYRRSWWILALILVVACLQEGIQFIYTASLPGSDEVFDIGVDLLGGLIGVLIMQRRVVRA
nr:hypothetical protein [Ardenticatena sp.]